MYIYIFEPCWLLAVAPPLPLSSSSYARRPPAPLERERAARLPFRRLSRCGCLPAARALGGGCAGAGAGARRRSAAVSEPDMIWSSTGTVGGMKVSPLMKK